MKTLQRQLGLPSVLGISMGAMLGSGLFVLPGLAAAQTGPSVWLAYLVAGFCVLPAALSKAELATAMPVSGGTYVYIDRAFGPLASTVGGIGLWLSLLLKSAFALVGFGAYLRVLTDLSSTSVGIALLAAIVVLNILGVRKVGKMQLWVVLLSVAGLIALSIWSIGSFQGDQLQHSFSSGTFGFLGTVGFVYISYAGVTKVAAVAEEVKNPGRNLPLGILLSLGIVTLLYAGVTFLLVGNVPLSDLRGDLRPIYTMALKVGGPAIATCAAVLGVLTMTSMANAGLMAASRFPFAMSREHLLPSPLAFVSQRFMTPVTSILLTGSMMACAILFLDVGGIAKLASSLKVVAFMAVNFAVIVLRETGVQWYKPAYRAPLYPLTQILGLLIGFFLLIMLGFTGLVAVAVTVVPGFLIFAAFGRQRTDRRGVLGRFGPRRELVAEPVSDSDAALPKSAAVVVPFVGSEGSPETLVDIAGALADGGKVEVVHLTEVPEQLMLDANLEEGPYVGSLHRRAELFAKERSLDVEFDALVTRDVARSVHEISRRVHCDWVVMEWRGRMRGFLHLTPLGWLVDHLSCNLALFKNVGLRSAREILVLAKPGPHDALVAVTADHLAKISEARLTFVRFIESDSSAMNKQAEMDYIQQLSKLCSAEPHCRVVEGKDKLKALVEISSDYDLLILGAPDEARFRNYLRGSFAERLTRAAACSVLRLKTPRELTHESLAGHGKRAAPRELAIADFLASGCVAAQLKPMTKEALFSFFARSFSEALPEIPKRKIEEALWERERTQNTAVEQGLALPHATIAEADRAYLGVFTSSKPIDYKAPDGKGVDVFFVTLGPPNARNTHLQILAWISKLVLNTSMLKQLRAADNMEGLQAAFLEVTGTS